jgi:hypothetical protein
MEEDLSGLKTSVEEMQKVFKYQLEGVSANKDTNKSIFWTANLILMLQFALQFLLGKVADAWLSTHQLLLWIGLGVYLGLIFLCLYIFFPTTLQAPIKADWDVLTDSFSGKVEKDVLLLQLSQYLAVIDINQKVLRKLGLLTKIGGALLMVLILVSAALTALPK